MTTTITTGSTTITPLLMDGYSASSTAGTISHALLDGVTVYSIVADGPRQGTFKLVFADEAAAHAAIAVHRQANVFTLADTDRPALGMVYVRVGEITLDLDAETRDNWIVSVGFSEVVA